MEINRSLIKKIVKNDPLSKVVGIGKGDGKTVACEYETYLYGGPEDKRGFLF